MTEWTDETAEWYASKYGEYPTNRLAIAALALDPEAIIVDIGCGTGAALRQAAPQVTQGRLIGIDPIDRMVEIARERCRAHPHGARIEIRQGPAEALPVEDGVADLVLAFDSYDHWNDTAAGFAEVRRILRPQGRLVVVKDGGIPGDRAGFIAALAPAGFEIREERQLSEDDVSCMMWVCEVAR
ncbi:MAG: class I SAM-dependent methyltransferase [Deltaproteobacteria bacterium]|nr:class I SAM-dependent methyltransferase [Deltaproteobacteria bacterium]